jgi:thiol:disulfide interchange protein DsbC
VAKALSGPLLALLVFAMPSAGYCDEAAVERLMEAKLSRKVEGVSKTSYLGLYEVRIDGEVVYTDEKVDYIFAGNIIDGKTMQNITSERVRKLSEIRFSDLPLDQAVKVVRGHGRRVIATFEDPNCGFCKKLAKDLQSVDDITVYTFLYPIMAGDSMEKSRAVWCAENRGRAWSELMIGNVVPASGGECKTPLEQNLVLGKKLRIKGTPTIFLSSGERFPGAVTAAQLEKALSNIAAAAK